MIRISLLGIVWILLCQGTMNPLDIMMEPLMIIILLLLLKLIISIMQ